MYSLGTSVPQSSSEFRIDFAEFLPIPHSKGMYESEKFQRNSVSAEFRKHPNPAP